MTRSTKLFDQVWKRVLLCLLLGWFSSQALVLLISMGRAYGTLDSQHFKYIDTPGSVLLDMTAGPGWDRAYVSPPMDVSYFELPEIIRGQPPRWIQEMVDRFDAETEWSRSLDRVGWPLLSNSSESFSNSENLGWMRRMHAKPNSLMDSVRATDLWLHDDSLHLWLPHFRGRILGWEMMEHVRAPLRPMWGGLTVNSAVYGAVWFVVVPAPFRIRRALRRRAGKCVKCKYDLTGLSPDEPCPECGRVESSPTKNTED